MWRIPHDRLYRAFPELDQFTDAQCEDFVSRARASRGFDSIRMVVFAAVFAAAAMCCAGQLILGTALFAVFRPWFRSPAPAENLMTAICIAMWVGGPSIAGLLARDLFLRRRLRAIIWGRLEQARCPHCRYSLLGQRVLNDRIRCPECGGSTTLAELGFASADDLIPPLDAADTLPPSRSAGLEQQ